jgi:DNA/RNA endonuclease YhcR with UshA esterase domain
MHFWSRISFVGLVLSAPLPLFAGSHSPGNSWNDSSMSESHASSAAPETCLAISDAEKHVGKTNCVAGTVVRVEEGNNGVTFLDFCADYHSCPFTVVVFRADLRSLGDVHQLQGRTISIRGRIEEYDDRAEIILRHPQQLGDSAGKLTALPKDYDVERQGHYSAGTFRPAKAKKAKHARQAAPVSIEDPEVP